MPRTDEQNQIIKDKRRAKIIKAATRVFAENGFDKVPIDDITKASKCSHGLFYHYFGNKDVIIEAIVEESIRDADLLPPCHKALEARGNKGLKIMVDYLNKVFLAGPSVYVPAKVACSLSDYESIPESLKRTAKENNILETLETLIAQGQEEGKIIAGEPKEIAIATKDVIFANFDRLLTGGRGATIISGDIVYNMLLKAERED